MKKRNETADAFFECVSSFSKRTGARDLDSSVDNVKNGKTNELSRMTCIAKYDNFDIIYFYAVNGYYSVYSTFGMRIVFDRSKPYIKFTPYDLMYLIDETDFSCYSFSYIESPQRMKTVFESIEPRLQQLLPKLDALSRNRAALEDLYSKFFDSINAASGRQLYRDNDEEDLEELLRFLSLYYAKDDAFYASKAYGNFLRGNYNAAYNGMRRIKNKTFYQIRLMSFMAGLTEKYEAVKTDADTTGDAVASSKTQFVRIILTYVILMIPMTAIFAGLHYLFSFLLYHNAVWSNAYYWVNSLKYTSAILLPTMFLTLRSQSVTLIFYNKKRREYLKQLDKITKPKGNGCVSVLVGVALFMSVAYVFLSANSYASFYDDKLRLPDPDSVIRFDDFTYSEIDKVIHAKGYYDNYGNYRDYEQYIIVMNNERVYHLAYEVDNDTVKNKILPLMQKNGVEVKIVRDADDPDFAPVYPAEN